MSDLRELIHYDAVVKSHGIWGEAVHKAAKGDDHLLNLVFAEAAPYTPTAVRFMTTALNFVKGGQQVFALGPGFAHLLHETSCENVPRSLLRLPYSTSYVALPGCPWRVWGGSRTGMHDIAGAYLSEGHGGSLYIAIWAKANTKSFAVDDDASFWVCIGLPKIPPLAEDPDCVNMEAYLDGILGDPDNNLSDIGVDIFEATPQEREEQMASVRSVIRVCVNLVLYLNSANADVTSETPPERRKMNKQKRKRLAKGPTCDAKVVWVGSKIEREEREARARAGASSSTWAYRRGHFHHYWVGPKKDAQGQPQKGSHRVQKWVAPIRRDMAEVVEAKARLHMIRGKGLAG